MPYSIKKISKCLFVLAIPSIAVYLGGGEALQSSDRASEYIGLIFSILAASLFATISIVGNPSMLVSASWKSSWKDAKAIQKRLKRLTYLFVLYLIVLALIVLSEIVKANELSQYYSVYDYFAFASIFAFLLSLWLPFEMCSIQEKRLEDEIKLRKSKKQSNKTLPF